MVGQGDRGGQEDRYIGGQDRWRDREDGEGGQKGDRWVGQGDRGSVQCVGRAGGHESDAHTHTHTHTTHTHTHTHARTHTHTPKASGTAMFPM